MGLREFLPESIRITGRAWFRGAAQDVAMLLSGKSRPALVPPARLDTNGVGDYIKVGDAWLKRFREHGLKPEHDVLEMGCGTGRMARALVGQQTGQYFGYDVIASTIAWAGKAFAPYPNFQFKHLDVYNDLYNPRGKPLADDFMLDTPPVDFGFATSLFSHLDPDISKLYLREFARLIRGGGGGAGQLLVSVWAGHAETRQSAV